MLEIEIIKDPDTSRKLKMDSKQKYTFIKENSFYGQKNEINLVWVDLIIFTFFLKLDCVIPRTLFSRK